MHTTTNTATAWSATPSGAGHFGFEKNKPASFKCPLYSFIGDWTMYKDIWVGTVKIQLAAGPLKAVILLGTA